MPKAASRNVLVGPYVIVPQATYEHYRMLGRTLLDETEWTTNFFVNGVALSKSGLVILTEKHSPTLAHVLKKAFGIEALQKVIGPISVSVQGGESIGAGSGRMSYGTLGCLVRDANKNIFGLTCDHVVGATAGQAPGDPVWSPASAHGGSARSKVGSFDFGCRIDFTPGSTNKVDAALVKFDSPAAHARTIVGLPGAPSGVATSLKFGQVLRKSGWKTKVTSGQFMYIVTFNVAYHGGTAKFIDQIGIDGGGVVFADKGDSGAVVVNAANEVAGLLFAAAPQSCLGFANPIDDVAAALGVSVA